MYIVKLKVSEKRTIFESVIFSNNKCLRKGNKIILFVYCKQKKYIYIFTVFGYSLL